MAVFLIFHKSAGGFKLDNGSSRRTLTLVEMVQRSCHNVYILNINIGNNSFELLDSSLGNIAEMRFEKSLLSPNLRKSFFLKPEQLRINIGVQDELKNMISLKLKNEYNCIFRYVTDAYLFDQFNLSILDLDDAEEIELKDWLSPFKVMRLLIFWFWTVNLITRTNLVNFIGPTYSVSRYLKLIKLLGLNKFQFNFVHIPNLLIYEDSNCR